VRREKKVSPYHVNLQASWARRSSCLRLASGEEKQSQGDSKYFYAAWESFVVFNQPYDNLLPELESAYAKQSQKLISRE